MALETIKSTSEKLYVVNVGNFSSVEYSYYKACHIMLFHHCFKVIPYADAHDLFFKSRFTIIYKLMIIASQVLIEKIIICIWEDLRPFHTNLEFWTKTTKEDKRFITVSVSNCLLFLSIEFVIVTVSFHTCHYLQLPHNENFQ